MNVSPVTSSSITATSLTAVGTTQTSDPAVSSSGTDSTKLSKMGELMGKLQNLEASDPDKAKQVLAKIASDLSAKAEETGDDRMKALAGKFDEAAKTGDLSGLQPRPHAGGEHHHHRPPPAGDSTGPGPNAAVSDASKVASYTSAQQDRRAEIESIVSGALDGAA